MPGIGQPETCQPKDRALTNQLRHETSPYLLQHKDNPVHWRAWGEVALQEARDQDKPILLSVGYAACHWCHVMAHESFENPDIANLINTLYIPIKVDREERPDLDSIYQHALALLGQRGGWPLTMFLTPMGEPFWGGTYFPPGAKYGRPGFPDVLTGVSDVYRTDKSRVANNVSILIAGLNKRAEIQSGEAVDLALQNRIAERFVTLFDPVDGGLKGAPKFPNCPLLETVWRYYKRTDDRAARDAVLTALDHMSQGGIYDHLGGGYSRYSTDEIWLAPHFEKMLYDNAQLIPLLLWGWQETGKTLYRQRIEETIGWLLREMQTDSKGFSAAIDADSEHEEGKFYIWSEEEIAAVLGDDLGLFQHYYGVSRGGNWEGKTILNRLENLELADEATENQLASLRAKLFTARETRIRPLLDDKILADWNGLTIDALAKASQALDRRAWLQAAIDAWGFVTTTMSSADGRLFHSWREGRSHPGTLDDYAAMARAGLSLFEITGERAYLDQVEIWVGIVAKHFADPAGSFYLTADDTENLIIRTRTVSDSAVPSGNGLMVEVLTRLHILTGNSKYDDAAVALIKAFSGELSHDFFSLGTYLNGVDFHRNPLQIIIVGDRNAAGTLRLVKATTLVSLPNRVLSIVAGGDQLSETHPAFGKNLVNGVATAYICEGRTCSLPLNDPDRLIEELRKR